MGAVVRYLAESPLCATEWLMPGVGVLASALAAYSAFWECTAHNETSTETLVARVMMYECVGSLLGQVGGVVYGEFDDGPAAVEHTEEQLQQWVPEARAYLMA